MRKLMTLLVSVFLVAAPAVGFAAEQTTMDKITDATKKAAKVTTETVKEHPGAATAAGACVITVAFFPPALAICLGAAAAGVGVDYVNDQQSKKKQMDK